MPLTIAAVALLGWWWAGLVPAAALLLGAALAPTDPVLAADVQVGEPTDDEDSEDEVRFALTSEAGLNDGLAFPFVYAAIAMAMYGAGAGGWFGRWFAVDVLYKGVVGVARRAAHRLAAGQAVLPRARPRSCAWPGTPRASWRWRRPSSRTAWSSWPAGTASSRCSSPPARSGRPSGRTTTTRCCTTSPSRSNGC